MNLIKQSKLWQAILTAICLLPINLAAESTQTPVIVPGKNAHASNTPASPRQPSADTREEHYRYYGVAPQKQTPVVAPPPNSYGNYRVVPASPPPAGSQQTTDYGNRRAATPVPEDEASIGTKIANDYRNFYSGKRLARLGGGVLGFGLMANTRVDEDIQDWYQDDVRGGTTDKYSKNVEKLGDWKTVIPLSLLAGGLYFLDSDSAVGNWGLNSVRAYTVGLPAMWIMQNATGASRPDESNGSKWKFFNDDNGVSERAFVGAVPFLTLARTSDNGFVKYLSYFVSALPALSRINDDENFASQAMFGWYMAYESVGAVLDTNDKLNKISITPVVGREGYYGVNMSARW